MIQDIFDTFNFLLFLLYLNFLNIINERDLIKYLFPRIMILIKAAGSTSTF